jgi:hypothetical protein
MALQTAANRLAALARARSASTSRFFGAADVTSCSTKRFEAAVTSSTARAKAASFARDGYVKPLILRTYWSEASRISSFVAGGS